MFFKLVAIVGNIGFGVFAGGAWLIMVMYHWAVISSPPAYLADGGHNLEFILHVLVAIGGGLVIGIVVFKIMTRIWSAFVVFDAESQRIWNARKK